MVTSGVGRGATVLLATLTPVGDVKAAERPGVQEAVEDLNERIRQIAQDHGLGQVVDLFAVFDETPSLIGRDGLHPTADGYRIMADEFMKTIMSRWEETEGPALSLSR
jgi:lysophospholipase L1-like esterase